jgi:hypothetical protein
MKVNKLLISIVIGFIVVFSAVTFSKQKNVKLDNVIYVGTDKDVLSKGQNIKPDGINDLHFQIVHDFQKNDELVSVTITKTAIGVGYWGTNDLIKWVIAVKADGKLLNATANLTTLGNLSGKVKLDIYFASNTDPKLNEKNNTYNVTLTTKDKQGKESVINKTVTMK